MDEVIYPEYGKYIYSACFNLTDACNLKCRYCFVEQHPHFMTLDVAKKGVEFLINNLDYLIEHNRVKKDEQASIIYFGGEPTILFDEIIIPLTEWAVETYPNRVNFNMTTNGTLLNQERINFMKKYNIIPLLSIDGAPETQNFNRPCQNESLASFDLVAKNIPYLLETFPYTTFRSTISQEKVDKVYENYLFAAAAGFKNIFMIPNSRNRWTTGQIVELDRQYQKIYEHMLNDFRNNKLPMIRCRPIEDSFVHVLQHDLMVRDNLSLWKDQRRSIARCGLGTTGCSIGYDGTIYGCQEQTSQSSSNLFNIGNIYDGIDIERHKKLLNEYGKPTTILCEDEKLCDSCELRNICLSYACPSTSWTLYNNTNTNGISFCMWLRIMYHYAAELMNILTTENNLTFKYFLDEMCEFDQYFPQETQNE